MSLITIVNLFHIGNYEIICRAQTEYCFFSIYPSQKSSKLMSTEISGSCVKSKGDNIAMDPVDADLRKL